MIFFLEQLIIDMKSFNIDLVYAVIDIIGIMVYISLAYTFDGD